MAATAAEILGVPETATAEEIKAARRRLARRFHPDRVGPVGHDILVAVNAAAAELLARVRPAAKPSEAIVRYRPRNRWDDELAPTPARGRLADLAA